MNPAIFREYDIRGVVPTMLDAKTAYGVGRAFVSEIGAGTIAVGYDGRVSSPELKEALIKGLVESGAEVIEVGRGPSPMLYFAGYTLGTHGAIMVTGSHNAANQNGFKLVRKGAPFFNTDIQKLRRRIEQLDFVSAKGSHKTQSVFDAYVTHLLKTYQSQCGLKIAWDAGNGAAGEVMVALTKLLPGTHILLNEKIDGTFPAHHPDPTVAENLQQLIEVVKREKCDIGVAFDGDGDRIGAVDATGDIVWGDQLLSLLARDVLADVPGATIIADVKASQLTFEEIARLGGKPLMWKTGHSHIKSKMMETGAMLAGEMSGHVFFKHRYFGYDDAIYAAVRLLSWLAKQPQPLHEIRATLPRTFSTPEIRLDCDDMRKFAVMKEVVAQMKAKGIAFNDVDGVRVTLPSGAWWLLRASNTQAILVARAEGRTPQELQEAQTMLEEVLSTQGITL